MAVPTVNSQDVILAQVPLLVKLADCPAELKKWQDAIDENRVQPFPAHIAGLVAGKLMWLLGDDTGFCACPEEAIAGVCEVVTSLIETATPHKRTIWAGVALGFGKTHLPKMVNNIDRFLGGISDESIAERLYRVNSASRYGEQAGAARTLWLRCLAVCPMPAPLEFEFARLHVESGDQYSLVTPGLFQTPPATFELRDWCSVM